MKDLLMKTLKWMELEVQIILIRKRFIQENLLMDKLLEMRLNIFILKKMKRTKNKNMRKVFMIMERLF